MSTKREKSCNLFIKNLYFEKKVPKVKKHLHFKSNVKTKWANEENQIFLNKNDPTAPRSFY